MIRTPHSIDLKLVFSYAADGTIARWEADVIGVRQSIVNPPYDSADLALVLKALDVLQDPYYPTPVTIEQHRRFAFTLDEQERLERLGLWNNAEGHVHANTPRQVGRTLYRALTSDPVGKQALNTVRDHAVALAQPIMLSMCFPADAIDLAALPWELLWDDEPTPLLFSRGGQIVFTRHLDLAQALPPPYRSSHPLRILAITPHAGTTPELRQIEREARMAAWKPLLENGQATILEVSPATRRALLRLESDWTTPDIVHYFGHGRYHAGQGALLLDDKAQGIWTDVAMIATLFSQARLVFLHACQGAMVAPSAADGCQDQSLLTGIGPALSAAGVPLVVGMQLSVRTMAAASFSRSLYRELATGASVQQAVSNARRALYIAETDRVSWFVPTVYVRSRGTEPIYMRPQAAPRQASRIRSSQIITARSRGRIESIRMHNGGAGEQQATATHNGRIANAALNASDAAHQQIQASDGGEICDVQMDA